MTEDTSIREERLERFDLSFVLEKLRADRRVPAELLPFVDREFRRFLMLVLREKGPLAMIDRRIDELWHSFILFTPQYRAFCDEVMGFFVDHQPRTSMTPVPVGAISNFVSAYTRHFGALPAGWLEDLEPAVREKIQNGDQLVELGFDWSGWTGRPE
jgi:hypothetical protein